MPDPSQVAAPWMATLAWSALADSGAASHAVPVLAREEYSNEYQPLAVLPALQSVVPRVGTPDGPEPSERTEQSCAGRRCQGGPA